VEPPGAGDLAKNSDIDSLASLLTKFVGIGENLHVPAEGFTRPPLAASFSHARIYCYQDQSLIDNKNQLFFNQNDSFVAQAIRDTLPFFVGAVTSQELRKQQALATLRRELRLLEREVESDVKWEETAAAKASALLAEARNVGLVSSELRHTTVQRTLAALADALRAPTESVSDLSGVEFELEELLTERASLRIAYTEIRDRLEEAKHSGPTAQSMKGNSRSNRRDSAPST